MSKKMKHNKKRNTAFLYEALIREITKSILEGNSAKKNNAISILKNRFKKGTNLRKELDLYKAIYETDKLEPYAAEKLLYKVKMAHSSLDATSIYGEQTALIKDINANLPKTTYANFVPSYKNLASISQIFNSDTPIKKSVLLEEQIIKDMTATFTAKETNSMKPIDNLIFKTFIQSFNSQYIGILSEEQKTLLNKYIMSFADNGAEFKLYLNEEIGRLRTIIESSLTIEEVKSDSHMTASTNKVLSIIEEFKQKPFDQDMLADILNIQNLTKEIINNGNNT